MLDVSANSQDRIKHFTIAALDMGSIIIPRYPVLKIIIRIVLKEKFK